MTLARSGFGTRCSLAGQIDFNVHQGKCWRSACLCYRQPASSEVRRPFTASSRAAAAHPLTDCAVSWLLFVSPSAVDGRE